MSRPACPADVADSQHSHAGEHEQYDDDAEITPAELAGLIAELTETRGLTKRQQDRIDWQLAHIEDLTRELAAVKVDTGYQCHDCAERSAR